MATLYSENFRKLLLKTLEEKHLPAPFVRNDEYVFKFNDQFLYLIKYIIKYKFYKSKLKRKDIRFHNFFKPEYILDVLHKLHPTEFRDYTTKEGDYPPSFIKSFCNKLDISSVMFYLTDTKDLYYDTYNHQYDINQKFEYVRLDASNIRLLLNEELKTPDVIFVHIGNTRFETSYTKNGYFNDHKINITDDNVDIISLKKHIIYNGNKYIMDSIILSNHNIKDDGHSIAGLTCNGERFVYNGWTKSTKDPAIKNIIHTENDEYACDLIPFDWYEDKKKFCINLQKCSLPDVKDFNDHNELCFSFTLGDRLIIYVKEDTTSQHSIDDISYKSFGDNSIDSLLEKTTKKICSSNSFLTSKRNNECTPDINAILQQALSKTPYCFEKLSKKLEIIFEYGKILQLDKYLDIAYSDIINYTAKVITPTEKKNETNLFIFIHSKTMFQIIC
jgi:hypothetical protein